MLTKSVSKNGDVLISLPKSLVKLYGLTGNETWRLRYSEKNNYLIINLSKKNH